MSKDRRAEVPAAAEEPRERLSDAADAAAASPESDHPAGARPSNTHLPSSQVIDSNQSLDPELKRTYESLILTKDNFSGPLPSSSSSSPSSSHFSVPLVPGAVAAIDWLEEGAIIEWDPGRPEETLLRLEELQQQARDEGKEQEYELAGQTIMVFPLGIGKGRQERLPNRFEFPGVLVAYSRKSTESRQHPNLYIKITGEACVTAGALTVRKLVHAMIAELGGRVRDSWVRRIDVCLDLPGVNINTWIRDAYRKEHFKTTFADWPEFKGRDGFKGFKIGSGNRVAITVYDKVREINNKKKNREVYRQAMIQFRWGGSQPDAATRVEYQIHKQWLDQFSLMNTEHVLFMLPSIVALLTEPEKRPTFAFTTAKPDRANKHQSRCKPHPKWLEIVATFRDRIGTPVEPLTRVDRGRIKPLKAMQMVVAYSVNASAMKGAILTDKKSVGEFVTEMLTELKFDDESIEAKSRQKCAKLGTLKDANSFDVDEFREGA